MSASAFSGLRWWLTGLSAILLAFTFWMAYVQRPSWKSKAIAWGALTLSAASIVWQLLRD